MQYKEQIIELINNISDEKILAYIFGFLSALTKKWGF